jgi:hypothetical protein
VNGPGITARRLRTQVRGALDAGEPPEPSVRAVLGLRFPREGDGASLDVVGAILGMSPVLVAHSEFAALCALDARTPGGGSQASEDAAAA